MRLAYLQLLGTLPKNRHSCERAASAAIQSEISREILRPSLRMTGLCQAQDDGLSNSTIVFPQPATNLCRYRLRAHFVNGDESNGIRDCLPAPLL
jgi:hypothetical protein